MIRRYLWIIGVDEVGRGPLAGPITLAAVGMKSSKRAPINLTGIRDSKKLSAKQRELWSKKIRSHGHVIHATSSVHSRVIDARGISYAARMAVKRCLSLLMGRHAIDPKNCLVMLDGGLKAPDMYAQRTIIKGDERVPIIAAASIVAKVHRDAYMTRLAKKIPQYGFEQHKGYGTVVHMQAIEKHGLSEHHRRVFCRKFVKH